MANYLSKFSKDLAAAQEPLRGLLSTKNAWLWTEGHTKAFQDVKNVLSNPPVLGHYDMTKPTAIRTDGSKKNGISVILKQKHDDEWKLIDCSSRMLKPTEKNWYPIEIEMLAITWGILKMNMYLHGLPGFIVETDHKPLIPILNSRMLYGLSPRIQAMKMMLLK